MKQSDLRVGNWILYEETIDDHEPKQINGSGIALFEDWKDRYTPIPLTDEWMLKFNGNIMSGYSITRFSCLIWDEEVELVFELKDNILEIFANGQRVTLFKNPSVHQLQNLYFSLTGEELKLK